MNKTRFTFRKAPSYFSAFWKRRHPSVNERFKIMLDGSVEFMFFFGTQKQVQEFTDNLNKAYDIGFADGARAVASHSV